jgi:hypothetical protein
MVDKQIAAALADAGAKPAKPADAFGDPDRRRGMVSFLTWAFFLSEAFKGIQAEAAGLKATDALDPASSGASSADGPAQDQPSDAASYNEWPIALPPDAVGKFPVAGHLPQIPEVGTGQPDDFNLARGRFDVPSAYGGGGGGETHGAVHGTSGSVETGAGIHTEAGNPLVDVGLHLEPGDELGLNVGLSLPSGGETLQGILGSPVLALNHIVGETVVPVVSDLTTVLSSVANSLAGGLLGGPLASSGLINILGGAGSPDSGSELFSGGKYTDYHLALQAGDTAPAVTMGHDAVGVGFDVGDLTGGLIPALGQITHGSGHDAGTPHIGLPSAVDELLLRGSLDIVM